MKREDIVNPFDFPLSKDQEDVVLLAMDDNNPVVLVDSIAGSAKEQPVSCIVKTPLGDRFIGSLKVGDYVFGRNGKPTRVLGVHPQGSKDVYKVTFRDKTFTFCGLEHNWAVNKIGMKYHDRFKTMTLSEMLTYGVIGNAGQYRMKIPMCSPVEYPKKDLIVDPYVLGCFLGDGSFRQNTPVLSSHADDEVILDEVTEILERQYKVTFVGKKRNTSKNGLQKTLCTKHTGGPLNSNPFSKDLRLLGLGKDKIVPTQYLYGDVNQRIRLLQGLMDTDGSICKNRTTFSNTNRSIILAVKNLVQSLGGTCIEGKPRCREGRSTVYCLNVKMFFCPFSLKRKADKWSFSCKNPPSRYITDIIKLDKKEEQVCITVDAKDSLYLTDNYIVTHNTTTQISMAHNIYKRSMYLTFSKALAVEASTMFPSHVECKTIHALAFREVGHAYASRLTRPRGAYKNVGGTGNELAKLYRMKDMELTENHKVSANAIGLMVKNTVAKYEASDDLELELTHIPEYMIKTAMNKVTGHLKKHLIKKKASNLRRLVLSYSEQLWKDRVNLDKSVLCTHDTYVKIWALTNPIIDTDVLYLDEVQDASNVFVGIVKKQIGRCKMILVGDPDQNLYAWRYSVNALELVDGVEGKLGQSFRFGAKVGELAETILGNGRSVKGWDQLGTQIGYEAVVDESKPFAKLYRINAALVSDALDYISEGKKVNIDIDVNDYIKILQCAEKLYLGDNKKVKHEEIVPYDDWDELKVEAEYDGMLKRVSKIVESGQVNRSVTILKTHKNTTTPDVILTTSHKAKGKTYQQVIIDNSAWESNYDSDGVWVGISEGEKRLLYVAATRASHALEYNNTIREMVELKESGGDVYASRSDDNNDHLRALLRRKLAQECQSWDKE